MVQNKKQTSSKPKFAEVIIGNKDAKEMYEVTNKDDLKFFFENLGDFGI